MTYTATPQIQVLHGGSRASRWAAQESPAGAGNAGGAIVGVWISGFGPSWATRKFQFLRSVTQADSVICPQVSDARQTRAVTTGRAPCDAAGMWGRGAARGRPAGAQHERAGRVRAPNRGRLYRWPAVRPGQRHGHLTRSRPQDSALSAAAPKWEPRKPLGGARKPRRRTEAPAGLSAVW